MVKLLEKLDVDGVTVHLREDRRHIIDSDVKRITNESHLPVNLNGCYRGDAKNCYRTHS